MEPPDFVFEMENGKRVRFPGAMGDRIPWLVQTFWTTREDGAIAMGFVTNEPTVETIASKGDEVVASFVVLMQRQQLRQLIEGLTTFAGGFPPD